MNRTLFPLTLAALVGCNTSTDITGDTDSDTDGIQIPDDTFVVDTSDEDTDTDDGGGSGGGIIGGGASGSGGGGVTDCSTLPTTPGLANVCDLSLNDAEVVVPTTSTETLQLITRVSSSPNPPGAFVGQARGNMAYAGLHMYNRKRLDQVGTIEVEAKRTGQLDMNIGLQVDLECDGAQFAHLQAMQANLLSTNALDNGYTRYTAATSQPVWTSSREIVDPDTSEVLVCRTADPMCEAGPQSLVALLAQFPDACLRNFASTLSEMPGNSVVTSGFLLEVGGLSTLYEACTWDVRRIAVAGDEHLPPSP